MKKQAQDFILFKLNTKKCIDVYFDSDFVRYWTFYVVEGGNGLIFF